MNSGTPYTDPWFPPTSEALFFANKSYQMGVLNATNAKNIEWKRARSAVPNAKLFD
jgi:hypothetical protein